MADINSLQVASIKVVGVGGAGNNAVNRMIDSGVEGVEFIVMNTDAQVVNMSKADKKLILGVNISKGLGAGANPDIGRQAAIESKEEITEMLKDADMIFLAAGMGGGTGTGATPIIAKIAKDLGILTVAIVTKPFTFEGKMRSVYAIQGIEQTEKNIDSLITISNDKLLKMIGGVPLKDSFKEADNILRQGVQTITDLIAVPALINLDFADIRTVLLGQKTALFGVGIGSGKDKAIEAANKAISSPLLESSFKGAKNAIINVTGGDTMTLFDANDAVDIIRQAAYNDINIIFGVAINHHLKDEMIVTVIATGFEEEDSTNPTNQEYESKLNVQKNNNEEEIKLESDKSNIKEIKRWNDKLGDEIDKKESINVDEGNN